MLSWVIVSVLALSGPATDLEEPAPSPPNGGQAIAQSTGKKKKVIRLDAMTVEGRIQKPQAFYILQRSNLNFDELNRTESFVPKVMKSVEREPF